MAKLSGTVVVSTVVPTDTQDTHATHDAIYGKGGYRVVDTITDRNNITEPRRTIGMLVKVLEDGITYELKNGISDSHWEVQADSNGNMKGDSAYDIAIQTGAIPSTMTKEEFVQWNRGPQGEVGPKGDKGQDGKIAGYQPTNIAPIKFKTPYEKTDYGIGVEKVVDKSGKIKLVSRKDAIEGTNNGTYTPYERPKDSTVVNVMGEGKPIELADQFGEYYANKDTGEPIKTKDGKIAYKKLNEKTSKTIESIDQSKKTIASLNNMVKILDKNPEAVGSIGENPYEYVANYANDILGIPTKELANRTTIQGASGVLAAMTRKIYENGVMTDEDYQRYKKT
jgi:hypothetical protein